MRLRYYKPIKIFHLNFGYGWWWGSCLWFWKIKFAIIPVFYAIRDTDMPEEWYDDIAKETCSWKFLKKL